MKLGDESYYIGAAMRLPESWRADHAGLLNNPDALRQDVSERFADWPEMHTDLIKYSDGTFHPWPQYSLAPEELKWDSVSGVTLIGDAASLT